MNAKMLADYTTLLSDIKQRIRHTQTLAVLAVNDELIRLYWEIGALIDARQKQAGWGAAVIPHLAPGWAGAVPDGLRPPAHATDPSPATPG